MEHIQHSLAYEQKTLHTVTAFLPCQAEDVCFFDIETTGLSPQVSSLYLIGSITFRNGQWWTDQWFADDYTSEELILRSFSDFVFQKTTFVHYNGSTFDIPYLEKKYAHYHIPSPFIEKGSFDIYRQIMSMKRYFPVKKQKLTTMERLAGFQRTDTFSGKDCIRLYTEFMHKKFFHDAMAETRKEQLLCHNRDDLIGTLVCSLLLVYRQYTPSAPHLTQQDEFICLTDFLPCQVPFSLSYEKNQIQISYSENKIEIMIPLIEDTLYHFFEDYKNYYYLPKEDMAIHKSVGMYVEPDFREKATAATCYIKKTGIFFLLPPNIEWPSPVFLRSKREKNAFIALDNDAPLSEELIGRLIDGFIRMPG